MGEVMWPPWRCSSYRKVEMIISIIARLLQPWEGLLNTRGLNKSPQYVRYYFIVGQLLWKLSFLLLEVTCIKVYTSSSPTHCQICCSLGAPAIPLTQCGKGHPWLSSCWFLSFLTWWATSFSSKHCCHWLSWTSSFSDLFANASWLNPKCWCSFIPLHILSGNFFYSEDWLLLIGWWLTQLYLQPSLFF